MNKLICLLLMFALASPASHADEGVVPLQKGDAAPFSGVLFNQDKTNQLHLINEQLKYQTTINDSLKLVNTIEEDSLNKMEQRIKLYQDQNVILSDKISSQDTHNSFDKFLYFGLGAIITGGIAYGLTHIIR